MLLDPVTELQTILVLPSFSGQSWGKERARIKNSWLETELRGSMLGEPQSTDLAIDHGELLQRNKDRLPHYLPDVAARLRHAHSCSRAPLLADLCELVRQSSACRPEASHA